MFKTMIGCLDPKKNPSEEDIKKIPSYIFCRWLSGNRASIQAANMFNLYSDIPIENQYNVIKNAFAGKIKYIPYPKSVDEEKAKSIEYLIDYFKISEEKAKEYLTFISKDELNFIVKIYTDRQK